MTTTAATAHFLLQSEPTPIQLHSSQSDLNCIKPAEAALCILGNMGSGKHSKTVKDMVTKRCHGGLWLGLPLLLTLYLEEEDLQLYN